jgi:serine/threonine-protein kinase
MPMSSPSDLDDTLSSAFVSHLGALERAWEQRTTSQPAPRWQDYLPPSGPCPAAFLLGLLIADILGRIRAGKPALLAEPYFEDPRLREAAGAETDRLLAMLIHREYRERWRCGQQARQSEYLDRFPHLHEDIQGLVPALDCPSCGNQDVPLADEDAAGADCPRCGNHITLSAATVTTEPPAPGPGSVSNSTLPPPVAGTAEDGSQPPRRLGRYELGEEIARGGMGAVLLAHDPALKRDLAVKVLKPELHDRPELVQRFVEEAQITAQLPHPGIVPVHELGQDDNGLPFLAMKLVRGQTFEQLLTQRTSPAEDLPRFVGIFEQVCQAVAFAHSRRVIHRDLKPANVMVGRFGEVQVMDWGLAKPLGQAPTPEEWAVGETAASVVHTLRSETGLAGALTVRGATAAGTVLGTPAYMPPEQATGQVHLLDERCDVFGLGAMLCEVLTGKPPYVAAEDWRVIYMAALGTLEETHQRLDDCGAEEELVALVKECLSAEIEKRPRDAGVVAERVAAYQRGVQERLRQAEQERAAAQARVAEERKRRRLAVMLAAVVVLLLLAGGSWAWQLQQQRARQHEAGQKALQALEGAGALLEQGWEANDLAALQAAQVEANRGTEIARSGAASAEVQNKAADVQLRVSERLARAEKNRALLQVLLNVPAAQETRSIRSDPLGWTAVVAHSRVEEHYATAFRRWDDLDLDRITSKEAERLRTEPQPVVEEILASLDAWMMDRRWRKRPRAQWQRLVRVAEQLDRNPQRQQLRQLLSGDWPPPAGMVAQLRGQAHPARDPVSSVVLLARVCWVGGDAAGAESVLRQAVTARPSEVVLLDALARLLEQRGRLAEAIEYYRVARALRPQSGVALGMALSKAGRAEEAEAVLRELANMPPKDPQMQIYLGLALAEQNKPAEAEEAYHNAIRLLEEYRKEAIQLGHTMREQNNPERANAHYRNATALQLDLAAAYWNLGNALRDQKKPVDAEAAYREALALKPDFPEAYNNLGLTLRDQKRLADAVAAFREADQRLPDDPLIRNNLRLAERLLQQDGKP